MRSIVPRLSAAAAAVLVLAGCGGGPSGPDLPETIDQCEQMNVPICGTWQLQDGRYVATWADGATAYMTVVRFTDRELIVDRVDYGKNQGQNFTGHYVGSVTGSRAEGTVVYSISGIQRTGTWSAEW